MEPICVGVLHRETAQTLFEALPDAVVLLDSAGLLIEVNTPAERLFGYARYDILGQPLAVLLPARLQPYYTARWPLHSSESSAAALGGSARLWGLRQDGSEFPLEITYAPYTTAQGVYLMGVLRDLTVRYHVAEVAEPQATRPSALQEHNLALEQQVQERTAQLAATTKELEALCYSVSHDLRTPLRAIDGFSQALLEDHSARLDAAGQDYLRRVRAAGQRMGALIEAWLDLARLSRHALHRTTVHLSTMAMRIAAELRHTQPHRQVEWQIAPHLVVEADLALMHVVLEHLLGNAWKYTSKQAQARIELGLTRQDGVQVYFVRDDGVGFDMAYAEKLFGVFQRLHRPDEFEGTGIGLAIVERIIHRHGGKVWAEGAVGQGAIFSFTL